MVLRILFPFLALGIFNSNSNGQSFEEYEWENRLIFIVDHSENPKNITKQLQVFQKEENELKDRNLIIFSITKKGLQQEFPKTQKSFPNISEIQFPFSLSKNKNFSVYLVGYDGGVKLKQNRLVSSDEIFALIDTMPMRKVEMARQKRE
jgi:hypothetical protein